MSVALVTHALWLCCFLPGLAAAQAEGQPETKVITYRNTTQTDLKLVVHYPSGWKETDQRPAIVFFFGGGSTSGKLEQLEPPADHLARHGMVAVRADYRVKSRHGVSPRECVEDAEKCDSLGPVPRRSTGR